MDEHTPPQSIAARRWWTTMRGVGGLALLVVALLHIPIIGVAVDTGFRVDSGKFKGATYWSVAVMIMDVLALVAWATLDGKRPLLAALPVLLLIGTILAAPLVMILF